jgi:hypothetical protein
VRDLNGNGRRGAEAALDQGLIEPRVAQLETGVAVFLEAVDLGVTEGEPETWANRKVAERMIVARLDSGRVKIFGIVS